MKKERILIFTDKHKQTEFENTIEVTQSEANRLIDIFHSFQPWNKIKTIQDFESLCIDPIKAMDQTLITNSGIDLKATGGKLPAPDMVAQLLDIDRNNYINIVKGQRIEPGACKPCGKLKVIKQGQGVLNYATFKKYQEYLIFDIVRFIINESEVEKKKETFNFYIEDPKQLEVYSFWHSACDTLNSLSQHGCLGDLNSFSKTLNGRITYSYQTNKLSLDMQSLLYEIQNLKK